MEKGQPLILGANKMEGGYNFAVEASEDSEVSLLLYKKRGAAAPVEIVFPKDFHTGRVWALKLCSASLKDFEYNYKIDGEIVQDPYAYGLHGSCTSFMSVVIRSLPERWFPIRELSLA